MALPQTSFSEYFDQIANGAPVQNQNEKSFDLSGDTAPPPTGGPVTVDKSASPSPPAPAAQAPAAVPQAPFSQATPAAKAAPASSGNVYDFGSLFAPVTSQVGAAQKSLGEGKQSFESAAGPSRSYAGVGGQQTLETALKPTGNVQADTQAKESAKGLVGASYQGPQGIDQGVQDVITKAYQSLTPRTQSLGTTQGAADLVRERTSGLSAGERAFEAKNLLKNTGYKTAARNVQEEVGNTYADYLRSKKEAEDFAQKRAAEEADISKQSKDFLTGQRTGVEQSIANKLAADTAREADLQGRYDEFTKGGELGALSKLITPEEQAKFDTETGRTVKEAETVKAGVLGKPEYAKIKDVPLMQLMINKHGREALQIPRGWWKENTAGLSKKEKNELKELARQRQLELESSGFSPGSKVAKNQNSVRYQASLAPGKFSAIDPLYFNDQLGKYETPDARSYVNLEMGNAATRGSEATDRERQTFNIANQLLDEADQIQAEDPFRASQIRAEAQRFFDEQGQAISSRTKELAKSVKSERKQVKEARGSVRASRHGLSAITGAINRAIPNAPGSDVLRGGVKLASGTAAGVNVVGGAKKITPRQKNTGKVG